eukprot:XP_001696069.1 predicted protein [Chlamydomonas reinhardtii]
MRTLGILIRLQSGLWWGLSLCGCFSESNLSSGRTCWVLSLLFRQRTELMKLGLHQCRGELA